MASIEHARPINHIGVSVTDVEETVAWYSSILGFRLIGSILTIDRATNPKMPIFLMYPASLQKAKIAFMTTGNGVGFEVFEFVDPKTRVPQQAFEYDRGGFFHICVTDPHPATLASKVETSGGQRVGESIKSADGFEEVIYLSDPWGNVVEVQRVSFDQMATRATKS